MVVDRLVSRAQRSGGIQGCAAIVRPPFASGLRPKGRAVLSVLRKIQTQIMPQARGSAAGPIRSKLKSHQARQAGRE